MPSGDTLMPVIVSVWPCMLITTAFRRRSQALTTFSMPPV